MPTPTPDLFARSQFLDNPTRVSVTTTSAQSAALSAGIYVLHSTAACFWLQGNSPTALVTSIPLPADVFFGPVYVDTESSPKSKIAAITASGTATLSIIKVS